MANKIKFKRGAKADLPILETAEPAFCTDTNELYVGSDGTNVKFLNENEVAGIQQDINEKMDTQDKELDDKITVLQTDKADKTVSMFSKTTPSGVDGTKLYEYGETGIYLTNSSGIVDLPNGWVQGRHVLVVFNPSNPVYGGQIIMPYEGSRGTNKKIAFRNTIKEGSQWRELATTEKIDNLFLKNGFTGRLDCNVIGDLVCVTGVIQNTSTVAQYTEVATTSIPIKSGSAPRFIIGVYNGSPVEIAVASSGALQTGTSNMQPNVRYTVQIIYSK